MNTDKPSMYPLDAHGIPVPPLPPTLEFSRAFVAPFWFEIEVPFDQAPAVGARYTDGHGRSWWVAQSTPERYAEGTMRVRLLLQEPVQPEGLFWGSQGAWLKYNYTVESDQAPVVGSRWMALASRPHPRHIPCTILAVLSPGTEENTWHVTIGAGEALHVELKIVPAEKAPGCVPCCRCGQILVEGKREDMPACVACWNEVVEELRDQDRGRELPVFRGMRRAAVETWAEVNGYTCYVLSHSLARVGPDRPCVSVRCSEAGLVQEVRLWK